MKTYTILLVCSLLLIGCTRTEPIDPCVYNGSQVVEVGRNPTNVGAQWWIRIRHKGQISSRLYITDFDAKWASLGSIINCPTD